MQPRSNSDGDKLARLHKQASETASLIREKASDDTVLLTSHFDADGISAGSIMLSAVSRLSSFPHLRVIDSVNERILDQIEAVESDLVIFTDIGSGYLEIISKILRNREVVVADHHQPLGEPGSNLHHFNTHVMGFDGSEEISGAGTAYRVEPTLDLDPVHNPDHLAFMLQRRQCDVPAAVEWAQQVCHRHLNVLEEDLAECLVGDRSHPDGRDPYPGRFQVEDEAGNATVLRRFRIGAGI